MKQRAHKYATSKRGDTNSGWNWEQEMKNCHDSEVVTFVIEATTALSSVASKVKAKSTKSKPGTAEVELSATGKDTVRATKASKGWEFPNSLRNQLPSTLDRRVMSAIAVDHIMLNNINPQCNQLQGFNTTICNGARDDGEYTLQHVVSYCSKMGLTLSVKGAQKSGVMECKRRAKIPLKPLPPLPTGPQQSPESPQMPYSPGNFDHIHQTEYPPSHRHLSPE